VTGGDHCWFKRSTGQKRLVTREDNNNNMPIIIITIIMISTDK
jgi:hypothetical protein